MWRFITMQSIPARCMCWPSGIKKKQATDNYCNLNIPTIQFRQEIGRTAGNVSEVVTEVGGGQKNPKVSKNLKVSPIKRLSVKGKNFP
jgi:hypothetical protein